MRNWKLIPIVVLSCALAIAQTHTPAQAENIVHKAMEYAKQNGMAKLIEQTNQSDGRFHVGKGSDLYLFIYDQAGICLGMGFSPQGFVGVNRMSVKDQDGKQYIREFILLAKTKGNGWVDYKRLDPVTNKIESKTSYVELYDDLVLGCGIYKP